LKRTAARVARAEKSVKHRLMRGFP
jgi:hypothetical protein